MADGAYDALKLRNDFRVVSIARPQRYQRVESLYLILIRKLRPAIMRSLTSSVLFLAIEYRMLSGENGRTQRAMIGPTSSPCYSQLAMPHMSMLSSITMSPPLHAQSDVLCHMPRYRIAPIVPVIGSDPSMPWVIKARDLGGAISINQDGPPAPTTMKVVPNRNLPIRSWMTGTQCQCLKNAVTRGSMIRSTYFLLRLPEECNLLSQQPLQLSCPCADRTCPTEVRRKATPGQIRRR